MREIKFRAWDDDQKQMLYGEDFYSLVVCFDKGFNYLLNKSKFKVMQYTGLYDKNGKEIYEGDIVKVEFPGLFYGVVEYDPPEWRMRRKSGGLWSFDERPEVIGNIYENPELLEEKK